ncbi:proliferation-associated protein 2G4-like isoform X2 [Tachypleus tridentatus]|uniref:proliferation-associated protein 2G4-like isoform X2 n=1 Tax=Tachypleus tridentatus TaxID=6853 RepID=UPI003FD36F3B
MCCTLCCRNCSMNGEARGQGMPSHRLKQFEIDGEKSIIQNPTEAQRKEHEKCEFELHEVYAIDVVISTGEGKDLLFNKLLKC